MEQTILVIEDEQNINEILTFSLGKEGYRTISALDGLKGLEMALTENPDLILLDVMLPGLDGWEVCKKVREHSQVPIIMLTAKDEVMDKVAGLDSGADDYLTKPFAIEELLARMRVAFKHCSNQQNDTKKKLLQVNHLCIDIEKRMVTVNDIEVELTKKEFELLLYLVQNKNIVLTREQILNQVWGYSYIGETNVVDVYIRYLRSKIDETFDEKFIHTIRGVGYYVKEE